MSDPANHTSRPTKTFQNFLKRWRSESMKRHALSPSMFVWERTRDENFLEGPACAAYLRLEKTNLRPPHTKLMDKHSPPRPRSALFQALKSI